MRTVRIHEIDLQIHAVWRVTGVEQDLGLVLCHWVSTSLLFKREVGFGLIMKSLQDPIRGDLSSL